MHEAPKHRRHPIRVVPTLAQHLKTDPISLLFSVARKTQLLFDRRGLTKRGNTHASLPPATGQRGEQAGHHTGQSQIAALLLLRQATRDVALSDVGNFVR